jgi:oligogalacturonide lyase
MHNAKGGRKPMIGKQFPAQWSVLQDDATGVQITRLTNYRAHSNHLYFTNNAWYDGGSKMVFQSDRDNAGNLFSIDLKNGTIVQLTDLDISPDELDELQYSHVDPNTNRLYYRYHGAIYETDLHTLAVRKVYTAFDGCQMDWFGYTADSKRLIVCENQDSGVTMKEGYRGFRELFLARPLSHVRSVDLATLQVRTLHSERCWLRHVNPSPTLPGIATFCHEGPWELVDNRIWGIDLDTGRTWPLRQRQSNEMTGHEYWFADGIHVAYECHKLTDGVRHRYFGVVRYDDTRICEVDFSKEAAQFAGANQISHLHSNDLSLIVGDGNRDGNVLRLWQYNGTDFDAPRVLCRHRCSFHMQRTHGHPRITPDGKSVLFTNDENGYGNLYLVRLPERIDSLPAVESFFNS